MANVEDPFVSLNGDDDEMDIVQALTISRKTYDCPVSTVLLCATGDDEVVVVESEVQGVKVVYSSRPLTWPPDFVNQDGALH